ncbi:putative U-box domain-containing protein 50 [Cicer arietinum]|uniref:putative U-box domain-containing protein 50 n=1 Tax=Cicer arietinum TaxID=3827 RepID=UPI003CC67403
MNGLFYVHQHKPDFCELFIICGGKQVSPRVKNGEITMEDDNGVKVAKMRDKMSFKDWLERMISDKTIDSNHKNSSRSPISSTYLEAHLEQNYIQEIENYLHELVSLNFEEGSFGQDNHDSFVTPIEPYFQKLQISDNKSAAEKFEILTDKLNEAYNTIQVKRKEEKDNLEKHAKAEWAIYICNRREEEVEYLKSEELTRKDELKKEVNAENEKINKIRMSVEESKQRLHSLKELQLELQNKLHVSKLKFSEFETKLEKVNAARNEMLMKIEELSRQRDIMNKWIMFIKEKNVTKISTKVIENECGLREYTKEDIILATHNFSEHLRLKSCENWSNVFRGYIDHSNAAIKMLDSTLGLSQQDFQAKVNKLTINI